MTEKTLSLFENFQKRYEQIEREAAALEAEAKKKRAGWEKKWEEARALREKEEEALNRQIADYDKVLGMAEAEERERLDGVSNTQDAFLAGKITAEEYYRDGKTPNDVAREAGAKTRERLAPLVKAIRAQKRKVYEAEKAELAAQMELYYLSAFPGQSLLARMKTEIQALEQGVMTHSLGWPQARARLDDLEKILGGLDMGHQWFDQTEAQVRALLFDPRVPDDLVDRVEEILREIAGSGKKYRVRLHGWGKGRVRLDYFAE